MQRLLLGAATTQFCMEKKIPSVATGQTSPPFQKSCKTQQAADQDTLLIKKPANLSICTCMHHASEHKHSTQMLTRTRKRNMARRTQWLRQAGGRNHARGGGVALLPTWLTISWAVCRWLCARRAHSGQRSFPSVPLKTTTSSRPPWYRHACDRAAR